jgi:hypothetical protein
VLNEGGPGDASLLDAPTSVAGHSEIGCLPQPPSAWRRWVWSLRQCFLGWDEEFQEPPLGSSVFAFGNAQVANAEAAQMVLYQCDFLPGSSQLTPKGAERLAHLVKALSRNFCPLVIEATPCAPGVDEARRLLVVNEAARCGFAVPPERVVIGKPPAVGLSGLESMLIYTNLLNQTQAQGRGSTGASGSAGSRGGASFP